MMEEQLGATFTEVIRAAGVTSTQSIAQLFVTPNGRTWTITLVGNNGVSCIVLSGQHWHETLPVPKGSGA